ncbi:trehalose synthase [Sulfurifustis variabilis]|uniref:Trehalose synthase n=1 Tax=Sulfurifustis variabilis TaxID=1675686 RepID=A0A1B4VBR7_9GAMM|nr:alpha-amylase family protein [Sulfurifustis variabilis]BAU48271.1 trehalose synthase [Sulfurifustis variabilis]
MWERTAILYGVDVGRFADSNDDGIGDFRGLVRRLDHVAALGADCVWILPCFPSAMRDNGYDVDNYYAIHPALGDLRDFADFVAAARERGLRVLLDLVVNHTSDRHPWFQAARRDPRSRYRDYYIWRDEPPPASDQETIFPGEEQGTWTYDERAGAFFHHRFYHFQPDLDAANREVRGEIERIMDFWLSFGVDGFRLDAASHLVEEKGHPEIEPRDRHEVLRELFAYLRSRRPDGVLMAEADVPPGRLPAFVSGGDQVNVMLNFLLNNYLWLALATERAEAIDRGLALLPAWPGRGQWANFLRNLDEADLEQLSGEKRAAVMRVFAPEASMRIYGRGIRRRLVPMLGADRRRLQLAFGLLFALPGAPVIVYGDEIGMGENLSQPGREAVRPPMQWSAEKNGGFSRAPRERLVAPAIEEGEFAYDRINVAAQEADPGSLLRVVRALARIRRDHPEIATGECRQIEAGSSAVWARVYRGPSSRLLAAHNLSSRTVETALRPDAALATEIGSGERLDIVDGLIRRRLPPYGSLWARLE